MKLKRILSLLASFAMAVTAVTGAMTVSVVSAEDEDYATSGKCGESTTWLINSDGVLVISGTGEIDTNNFGVGWYKLRDDINEIVVEDGITVGGNIFISSFSCDHNPNISKITLPSSLAKLNGCISPDAGRYTCLKDIYIYSKNISDASTINNTHDNNWSKVDTVWHVYKDSTTETSLRENLLLNDNQIEYISDNEEMPTVSNKTPVKLEPVGETSGPAGLGSKWEWNNSSNTLKFSGKGTISIGNDYKKYAETTEHIVIEEGITQINANTGQVRDVEFIVSQAFYGFTAVKDVKLPETLKEIGDASFYQTPITKIDLPSNLKTIGRMAFKYSNLEEISFPESLKEIGEAAFSNTKLKSINLREGMTIGGSAFNYCESLKEVTIPKNFLFERTKNGGAGMAREHCTFANCTGLEKIVIEDGCRVGDAWGNLLGSNGIVENFCQNCTSLKTVVIKGSIDYIATRAFENCPLNDIYLYTTELSTVTAKGTNTAVAGSPAIYMDSFEFNSNPTFHVVKGSTTETTLRKANYLTKENTVYLADTTTLETAIAEAETINTSNYTDESVAKFTEALENAKATLDNMDATQEEVDKAVQAIKDAKNALEEKKDDPSESDPSTPSDSSDPTSPSKPTSPTSPTGGNVKKTTSPVQRASEAKAAAEKAIKQAKITNLTAKAKGKKKITVSWKKVAKAAGYEVQASTKKNFKKDAIKKTTTKNKIVIKKLKSKKKYFVRVRAYATYKDAKGKTQKVYSKWVKSKKKVKVK